MKVALIVGHSVEDQGAYNKATNQSEYRYNNLLAQVVRMKTNLDIVIVYRKHGYSKLPSEVNKTGADLAISLHCNAFDTTVTGTETLSSGSTKANQFAEIIQPKMLEVFGLPNRGIKIKKQSDRGGLILHKTSMTCVLLEPFFIDNDDDFQTGVEVFGKYADAIIESINEYKSYAIRN